LSPDIAQTFGIKYDDFFGQGHKPRNIQSEELSLVDKICTLSMRRIQFGNMLLSLPANILEKLATILT